MNPVTIPWLLEVGFITWRTMTGRRVTVTRKAPGAVGNFGLGIQTGTGPNRPPLPSELLATFIIFGTYSVIADRDKRIGGLLAWGTLLGSVLILSTRVAQNPSAVNSPNPNPASLPYSQGQSSEVSNRSQIYAGNTTLGGK